MNKIDQISALMVLALQWRRECIEQQTNQSKSDNMVEDGRFWEKSKEVREKKQLDIWRRVLHIESTACAKALR